MNAMRTGGWALEFAQADAGDIASSHGKATAVPTPFNTVRRERFLFFMLRLVLSSSHAKRVTLHDGGNERVKSVIVLLKFGEDAVHRSAIIGV
jgi:hypothetical protein